MIYVNVITKNDFEEKLFRSILEKIYNKIYEMAKNEFNH